MMNEKHVLVQGAVCKCRYGTVPDALSVKSHQKEIANDGGAKKLIATTKDTGATFKNNSFGACAKMNNRPCKPVVQQWINFYERVTLSHGGKVLLEDSKAVCPVSGDACISVIWHGQAGAPAVGQMGQLDGRIIKEWNPAIDNEAIEAGLNENNWEAL
ncbi:MAG: DUF4280 domain-containing protein [Niabella sp.]|nr:DUF4280 domain-containing protein [Niabella sp.]